MLFSKKIRNALICGVAVAAFPLLVSARPKPDNFRPEKKTIQLNEQATVDGTTLAPGQYEVVIEGHKATFEHHGETVATAPCDWKTDNYKSPYDSVTISRNHAVQELQFEGSDQTLEVM